MFLRSDKLGYRTCISRDVTTKTGEGPGNAPGPTVTDIIRELEKPGRDPR
ncbi:hypothetical protein ACFV5N_27920, partial [Streptomyces sp. NPDC059853]